MKLVRTLLSILVLLVVVIAIAVAALLIFIDPNKLKPVIAEQVRKQTGYEVVMDGEFTWSLYPRLGVKVGNIRLYSPQQKTPFLDLKRVVFVTELGQLLRGNQKLRGDIYISDLALIHMKASNAHVGLHWQNNELLLEPMAASLYNGTFDGVARGRHLSAMPAWSWNVNFNKIDLQTLLADINPGSKLKLAGVGDVNVKAAISGKTREAILNSLNGNATFNVVDGIVYGVDLNYLLKTADALINKKPAALPTTQIDQTMFNSFKGSAVIKNGIASTSDLTLTSSALSVSAVGSVNLVYETLNMQLRLAADESARTKWQVPVLITGSLSRPDVRLDLADLNSMLAKQKLEDVKTKVSKEIKKHIHGPAGDALQKLLGR